MIKQSRFLPIRFVVTLLFLPLITGCTEERDTPANHTTAVKPSSIESFSELEQLLDFDSGVLPAGLTAENATVQLVGEGGSNTDNALEIRFIPAPDRSFVRFRPDQPWNWSGLREFHIALDVKNTGSSSVHLFLALKNVDGRTVYRRSGNVPVGSSNTYFSVLNGLAASVDTGMRGDPPPWETPESMLIYSGSELAPDLADVAEIELFVTGTIEEKQIVVDNIRLRSNPEYDMSYLQNIVDEFGQNAKKEYPIKVHSLEELQQAAGRELAELAAGGPLPDRSRFGGWKDGPRLEATGYFRTEKVKGKWWLVDPDGYLFFSNGLANVRLANLTTLTGIDFRDKSVRQVDPEEITPEDSIGMIWVSEQARESRFISSEVRNGMFSWLPDYGSELAHNYSFRRSAHRGPLDGGETFSFYRANLERRYGSAEPESFTRKWEEVTLERMLDWGFTSMGNWVDPAFYPNQRVPYFANGWIIGDFKTLNSVLDVWAPMPDAYDPEFVRRADITISVIAEEIKSSPWCVGVFVDNEKSWGLRQGTVPERYSLILDALSREASESPAKKAFTQHLQTTYGDVETLNTRWKTNLKSWEEFASGIKFEAYTQELVEDLSTMLHLLSEQYFRVVHDALRHYLPNHLYFGVRMAGWGMPEETVEAAVKYTDVLSFNIYEEGLLPEEWQFLEEIDLPSIIGEWHVGATSDTGLYHPGLVYASDQADRARMWRDYMESVLARPTMVGAHWFQYVDSPLTGRAFDGENYNVGFVTVTDIPYPEMVDAAREFNTTLYPKRYGEEH
jgi:agarase